MSTQAPIAFVWNGEAMVPLLRFARRAAQTFVVGVCYDLVEYLARSTASHRQYFAVVRNAWMNLNERDAERFPTPEHLRKYALIKAGYYLERSYVAKSKAEAQRIAAFMRPVDEYALVIVRDNVVRAFNARSQDLAHMNRREFQESKDAVFGVLAKMIGVDPQTLSRQQEAA
jgi:hypothetical protein